MMFRAAPIFRAGLRTASCRHRGFLGFRSEHTLEQSSRRNGSGARSFRWGPAAVLILGATAGTTLYTSQTTVQADEQVTTSAIIQEPTPLGDLIRAYVVYSICSVPFLVDNSPSVLSALTAVPGIKQVSEMVVRYTFFAQFVGGDTAQDTLPLLKALRREGKGVLLAYSVEVDEKAASGSNPHAVATHKLNVKEMIRSIDIVGDFEDNVARNEKSESRSRKSWVALKLSALTPSATSLEHLSTYLLASRPQSHRLALPPGTAHSNDLAVLQYRRGPPSPLSDADILALHEFYADLREICNKAKQRKVKVIIDAEHSWYQPAIDALTTALSQEFNRASSSAPIQPLVYGTYQAYLRRTSAQLIQSLTDADQGGYALGVKLVRGAYRDQEVAHHTRHASDNSLPPVWSNKDETDDCYNGCAELLISAVSTDMKSSTKAPPRIGVLFGTHNHRSCDLIMESLVKHRLATSQNGKILASDALADRVTFGQLFGMSNVLTDQIAETFRASSPMVIKYVPYGALTEVMPYLARRAIENKSVLGGDGGAITEKRQAGSQIWKRIFG